jgi:hypothetical protein
MSRAGGGWSRTPATSCHGLGKGPCAVLELALREVCCSRNLVVVAQLLGMVSVVCMAVLAAAVVVVYVVR